MRKIDSLGLLLCELQGKTFEQSIEMTETSSEIFVRRYMYSKTAKLLDDESIIASNIRAKDIVEMVEEEYKKSRVWFNQIYKRRNVLDRISVPIFFLYVRLIFEAGVQNRETKGIKEIISRIPFAWRGPGF